MDVQGNMAQPRILAFADWYMPGSKGSGAVTALDDRISCGTEHGTPLAPGTTC